MSKISKTPPKLWRGAVKLTERKYEVWALLPSKLGVIVKQGTYWVLTGADSPVNSEGMRFINSRDAADYLLKLKQPEISLPKPVKQEGASKVNDKSVANLAVNEKTARKLRVKALADSLRKLEAEMEDLT